MAVSAAAAIAQTAAKPAAPAAKTAKPASAAATSTASGIKLPSGVKPVRGVLKTAFSVKYQDFKIGTGAEVEPNKVYKIHYTGWRAADGVKFDSSYDHPGQPVRDKDGKPVLGPDGKPQLGDPQPFAFPQGMGRVFPGFDQGFAGMRVGGKRRLFIPWQLAYGTRAMPDRGADHPGIPAKSDLIFDVELIEMADMPAPQARPGMPPGGRPAGMPPGASGVPGQPGAHPPIPVTGGVFKPAQPGAPATAPVPGTAPKPAAPGATAQPATPPASAAPATPPSH